MSPRAACRLDTLGFEHVYDFLPGKADWLARGLPREGGKAAEPRAIDLVRQDAVTCRLTDRLDELRAQVDTSPYGFALVLAHDRTLLGRLRRTALQDDTPATAEDVMEPGPSTVRADANPEQLRERLERQDLATAIITDPDGRLLGLIRRADLPHP
jgi:Mg/Co/Ni transporter MgtE